MGELVRWVRVETAALRHHKLYGITTSEPRAVVAWLGGLLLSGDTESDGFIATEQLDLTRGRRREAEILVERRLWVPVDGGWQIHGWDEYQPTSATSEAAREQRRKAGQKSGEARRRGNEK